MLYKNVSNLGKHTEEYGDFYFSIKNNNVYTNTLDIRIYGVKKIGPIYELN